VLDKTTKLPKSAILPPDVRPYFEQLRADCQSLRLIEILAPMNDPPTWDNLYELELNLVRAQQESDLQRSAWGWRAAEPRLHPFSAAGRTCSGVGEASGDPEIEIGNSAIRSFPFFLAARLSFCWMRRVSSFCRSAETQVYWAVMSRSLWPAIFDGFIALPPTCGRHVMLLRLFVSASCNLRLASLRRRR